MAGFAAVTVEVAFDAGLRTPLASATWTDVSDYVDSEVDIQWGRTSELGQTSPSTCSLMLDNSDGRFTAGLATSPYYPDVKLDRLLRVTVTPAGGSPSVRFTGYIDSWPATWPGGSDSYAAAPITATSRTGRLGLFNTLRSLMVEAAVENGATDVFPLDEPEDSTSAGSELTDTRVSVAGTGKILRFRSGSVGFNGGQYLANSSSPFVMNADLSVAVSVRFTTTPANAQLYGPLRTIYFSTAIWAAITDGAWHRVVLAYDDSAADGLLYVDGQLAQTISWSNMPQFSTYIGKQFFGSIKDACRFSTLLDATDVEQDYAAFLGGRGLSTDEFLELLAAFVAIPSAEVDADAGAVNVGGVDIAGMSVVDAFRVVESTEGGVLIDDRDGDLRLIGRRARYGTSPVVTLDMANQEIGRDFSPTLDRSSLLNDVTGTNGASNLLGVEIEATSYRAFDQDSIDAYGVAGASVEVNAESPTEAYAAASWMVANHAEPQPRVPTLTFTPLLFSSGDQDDLLSVFLGDRVSLSNLPDQAPDTSLTVFVEGGSESWGPVSGSIAWSVSPVGLEDSVFLIDTDDIDDLTKVIGY